MDGRAHLVGLSLVVCGFLAFPTPHARAQLFENLEAFGNRLDTGDPAVSSQWDRGSEGPKGIAAGDLDGDGSADLAASNLDGTVTVYLNDGSGGFSAPRHLQTGLTTLRDIAIADFTGDGRPDIATAAVIEGQVALFENLGGGTFGEVRLTEVGQSARNLEAGDFDGDGALELAVAGPSIGVKQLRWTPEEGFLEVAVLPRLATGGFTKPVYSLKAYREPNATKDSLVVTHAESYAVWTLATGESGLLEVEAELPAAPGAYSLDIGPLTTPAATGRGDLVTAHRDLGFVEVRKASGGPARFAKEAHQRISIPGAPRAVRILDLDADGWNDVVVVLRFLDRVLTYRNDRGVLVASTEMPVGRSPRDVAGGDFNLDGQLDLAVINRLSEDISVLLGHAGQTGFGALDDFYLVDGEVAGLQVLDWNGDGRDDVVQLHRASGDVSVRLSLPGGKLAPPSLVPIGEIPSAMEVVDVNNDGRQDAVVANLGTGTGSISVRLGQDDGSLGPEVRYELTGGLEGRLFALAAADFDGDGFVDLAAGYADCRVGFYRGMGDGTFTSVGEPQFFLYEGRVMVTGDFDQDGDVDLAAAGYAGHLAVVENRGDLLTANRIVPELYEPPSSRKFGTRDIKTVDVNGDGDLDLVLGSGEGVMIYLGVDGTQFALGSALLEGTDFPASSVGVADLDGDSRRDLVVACQILSCVTILTKVGDGPEYVPALTVDVPSGRYIAIGDLDGDGHADLVGTGDVLWVALSGRRSERSGPPVLEGARPVAQGAVINEMLAVNNQWPLESDGDRTVDWVEIYNGGAETLPLSGWLLRLEKADADEGDTPDVFTFPPDASLEADAHLVVVFSKDGRSAYHTGFRLTGDGGTLTLIDQAGVTRDRLQYPPQRENLSYSRYADGTRSFVFNNFPSPGAANTDNGAVPPIFDLKAVWASASLPDLPDAPQPEQPIRFLGKGEDDTVIVSVSALYQRLDAGGSGIERVILFDDGAHGDGDFQDGSFAGDLASGLPAGAEIRFQIEVEDISDNVTTLPDDEGVDFFTLAVGAEFPPLELSEVVARNDNGLTDERDGTPDWVEIRNCSTEAVSLDGVFIAKNFFNLDNWFDFPEGMTLQPGGYAVVFCDGKRNQGPLHAPFDLDRKEDTLFLIGTAPHGAHGVIDLLHYGEQEPDIAFARQECGGPWAFAVPTPGGNLSGGALAPFRRGDANADGAYNISDATFTLSYLFTGGSASPPCIKAADANDSGTVDLTDAVVVLSSLFAGGPPPVAPFGECGFDPTPDDLTCESFDRCQ